MHHPHASHRRLAQDDQVIGHQPRVVPQAGTGAVGAEQVPVVIALRVTPVQAGQGAQVSRHRALWQALEQGGRGHQVLGATRQHLHHQVAAFQWRHAYAQGDVDTFLDQVDLAVGTFDMQLHQRALDHEAGEHGPDPEIQQGSGAAQAHDALRLGAVALDQLGGAFGFHQHGHAMAVVGLADFGHREVPGRALDQAHAQAFFQPGNAPAELGLGHVQGAAGGGKAAVIDHLGKVVKVVEVFHQCSPYGTLKTV
ncbi:hypothetical protein D3C79_682300 [compost metagenome]